MRKIGVFGWGVTAPKSKNIQAFADNLTKPESWLELFDGFGPSNFLVGKPDFNFSDYKPWIDKRFPPNRYFQLTEKMDFTSLFAIGSFIQALEQNPGIEKVLQELESQTHVYIGTGLGSIPTINEASVGLYKAQRQWNRFWASPGNNSALQDYLSLSPQEQMAYADVPANPETAATAEEKEHTEESWWHFWCHQSPELKKYLQALAEIDAMPIEGEVESGKLKLIKEKQRLKGKLQQQWQAPLPPWESVSANLLWNIHSTPAAQISMLGKIHGLSMAPVAACSTFNVCLKMAIDVIQSGEAKAVIIGATESYPIPHTVGAFSRARVAASGKDVSRPLTSLRGTHVSGGAAVWIVGDYTFMTSKGFKPLGMEPVSVGTSSDAAHIITPSEKGPQIAIRQALEKAGITANEITTWDLHATATPGDYMEISNFKSLIPDNILASARKGTFGHGLGVSGGWELTAQYMCYEKGYMLPTSLDKKSLNN
ncbi:MAG: beta-ketoacyl synthase N-terminal-like domain-containing protein, partial [Endozoicomonadaceae bacterium]|nr:beta-ketoacyl synthase N-terminal-like domain-containing protein [Endozoicomonadaceae bacterium]